MRFVILGAVGFGIGGAIGAFLFPFGILLGGAVGGASLGLALQDSRRVMILAGLGALGLLVGVFAALTLGAGFFNYAEVPITAIVGAVVGASLGAAFRDWRTILGLAVAGAVGFTVGYLAGEFLRFARPITGLVGQVGEVGSITVAGLVGGASLGMVLGYLESRKPAEERRARVR